MKIKINYPNDYGSEESYAAAVEDCGGCEESLFFAAMADAAKKAGLQFVSQTDYGAIWEGSADQCAKAEQIIPSWATASEIEEIEFEG